MGKVFAWKEEGRHVSTGSLASESRMTKCATPPPMSGNRSTSPSTVIAGSSNTNTSPAVTKTPAGKIICERLSGTGKKGTAKGDPAKNPGQGPPVEPVRHKPSAKPVTGITKR